jgi:hypothetical protein
MLVVLGTMMLGDVVSKVFETRVPKDVNLFVCNLVDDPKVAHFHCAGALLLDSAVGNAHLHGIVAVDRGQWLGMAHLVEDELDDFGFLNVQEDGAEFGFGGRCSYQLEDSAERVNGAI